LETSFKFALPELRRYEILASGWDRVWTPNEKELPAILEEYSGYERAGYAQAGLITGAAKYRNGQSEEALVALRAALSEWSDPDTHERFGRLLEICIAVECGRFPELLPMLDAFAQSTQTAGCPNPLPELAAHVAAVLRNLDPEMKDHERYSSNVHDFMSVLWAAFRQLGPAWFERRKWLTYAGRRIEDRLNERLDILSTELPATALSEGEALLDALRSGRDMILRVADYSGLELHVWLKEGVVQCSATWPALWRDRADETFYQTALYLSKLFVETHWGADHHSFDILLPMTIEGLSAARLSAFVSTIVDMLDQARKALISRNFSVNFQTSGSGIGLAFSRLAPAEALRHWQQQLKETGENPLLEAEVHCRVGDNYLDLQEGNWREEVAAAIQAYEKSLALLNKSEHKWPWANMQEKLGWAYLEMAVFSRDSAVQAANCLDQALTVWRRSVDAHHWAVLMVQRGRAARMRPGKSRSKTAIESCQAALSVFDETTTPDNWAWAQEELGHSYMDQALEQFSNRKPAVKQIAAARVCYEAALRVHSRQSNPNRWAALHSSLAGCELADQSENRREAITRSIGALRCSLEVFEEHAYPMDWGIVQSKLAQAYLLQSAWLPESAAESIACAEAALRVITRESLPEVWVKLQFGLGSAYRGLPAVNSPRTMELAIQCFQEILSSPSAAGQRMLELATRKGLGDAYLAMGQHDPASYSKAIDCLEKAFKLCDVNKNSGDWADLHFGIARAHLESGARPREICLRKAYGHASLCMKVAKRESMPFQWAFDHELLGRIDLALSAFTPEFLSRALQEFETALEVFTRRDYEVRWAANQDFIGRYYLALHTGNRPENLEKSIQYFQNSLEVFTAEQYARDRIVVLEQLVYALVDSSAECGQTRVEEAIRVAREGVELSAGEKRRPLWGQMQDALGFAYSKLVAPDPGTNIAKAIALQTAALPSYPKERFPVDYAIVQMHLGFSYLGQAGIVQSDELWDLALSYFEDAAVVLSKEETPRQWACIQNGMACASRRREDTVDKAVALHRSALEVLTPERFPENHAGVNLDLAETYLHFSASGSCQPEEAVPCFEAALAFYNPTDFPNRRGQIEARLKAADLVSSEPGAS
jgi:tetratricopeptide (TPR) repeat protein